MSIFVILPESRIEKGVDVKFGLDDLVAEPEQTAHWDGVRNYLARNHMRSMKMGQIAFFYHSNCKIPGIAGIVEVRQLSHKIESSVSFIVTLFERL